jgi:hypothetical protein
MRRARLRTFICLTASLELCLLCLWGAGFMRRDVFCVTRPSGLVFGCASSRGQLLLFRNFQSHASGGAISAVGLRHFTTPPERFTADAWPTHTRNSVIAYSGPSGGSVRSLKRHPFFLMTIYRGNVQGVNCWQATTDYAAISVLLVVLGFMATAIVTSCPTIRKSKDGMFVVEDSKRL